MYVLAHIWPAALSRKVDGTVKKMVLTSMMILLLLFQTACSPSSPTDLPLTEQLSDPGNVWADSAEAYFEARTQTLKGTKVTILYDQDHTGHQEERTVAIKDARVNLVSELGESPCVDAERSLQAWTFSYDVQLNVEDITAVVRTDGRDPYYPWFDLTGERCLIAEHDTVDNWISTRAECSMEELDAWSRDYDSMEEALFDWYLRTHGFADTVPPYLDRWGNTLVHREDGEGWSIYIPVDWQESRPREAMVQWMAPEGGASIAIHHLPQPNQAEQAALCVPAPDGGIYQVMQTPGDQGTLCQQILESVQTGMEHHSWEPVHVLPLEQQGQDLASAIEAALWQTLPGSRQHTQWLPLQDDGTGTAYGLIFRQIQLQAVLERKLLLPAVVQYREENGLYMVTEVNFPREDHYEEDIHSLFPARVVECLTSEKEVNNMLQPFHAEQLFWQTDTYAEDLSVLADAASGSHGESARLLIQELLRQAEEAPVEFNQLLYGDNILMPDQKEWVQGLVEHGCPDELLAPPDVLTIQNLAQFTTATEVRRADGTYMTSAFEPIHCSPVDQTSARVDFLSYCGRYTEEKDGIREAKGVPQLVTCWVKWNGVGWEADRFWATPPGEAQYLSHLKDVQKQLPEDAPTGLTEAWIQEKIDLLQAQCQQQANQMAQFAREGFS